MASQHSNIARTSTLTTAAAPLLWIAQAALLAGAVQRIADGAGVAGMLAPAAGFLLLGLVRATGEAWAARRLFAAARERVSQLRAAAAAALARRSPLDPDRLPSGQAASVMAEQAEAVLPWLLRYQPARLRVMLVPPVIALAVLTQSWLAALILVCAAPLIPLFMVVIGWRAQAASADQLKVAGGMNGFLLDRLRGLSTLRALHAIDATAGRLRATAEAVRTSTMAVLRIAFLSSTALELFSALGVALVAVYIGFHLLGEIGPGSWGHRLSLGQGLFILMLAPAFFEPLRELAAVWHDKASGQAALDALAALEDNMLTVPGAVIAAPAAHLRPAPAIDIAGLHFQHGEETALFDAFDLHVGAGEHVALVGPSGSGKTTLLALIACLAPANSGTIRIGGAKLDDASAAGLRAGMAWIGQAPHVFPATVRSNVALGRPGVSTMAVTRAIDFAGLADVQHATPHATLGEGGTGLSGGELVRLALARASVAPGAGLLLADEPTARLDRATSAQVIDALLALAEGRTLIVATHDLALAARIGRVIHIDHTTRRHAA
jgi:ATP-binding cassette subfamily C protein CydD